MTASRVFDEWSDGWHRAEADDTRNRPSRDCDTQGQQQGYDDYWTYQALYHPERYERHVVVCDYAAHHGELERSGL